MPKGNKTPKISYDLDLLLASWKNIFKENFSRLDSYAEASKLETLVSHRNQLEAELQEEVSENETFIAERAKKEFLEQKSKLNGDIYCKPENLKAPYLKEKTKLSKEEFARIQGMVEPGKSEFKFFNNNIYKVDSQKIKDFRKAELGYDPAENKKKKDLEVNERTTLNERVNNYIDAVAFSPYFDKEIDVAKEKVRDLAVEAKKYRNQINPSNVKAKKNGEAKVYEQVLLNYNDFLKKGYPDEESLRGVKYQADYRNHIEHLDDLNTLISLAEKNKDNATVQTLTTEKTELENKIEQDKANLTNFDSNFMNLSSYKNKKQKIGIALLAEADKNYYLQRKTTLEEQLKSLERELSIKEQEAEEEKRNNPNVQADAQPQPEVQVQPQVQEQPQPQQAQPKEGEVKENADAQKKPDFKTTQTALINDVKDKIKDIDAKIDANNAIIATHQGIFDEFNTLNFKNSKFAEASKLKYYLDVKLNDFDDLRDDVNALYGEMGYKERRVQRAENVIEGEANYAIRSNINVQQRIKKVKNVVEYSGLQKEIAGLQKSAQYLTVRRDLKHASYLAGRNQMNAILEDVKKSIPGFYEMDKEMSGFVKNLDNEYSKVNIFADVEKNKSDYLKVFNDRFKPYKEQLDQVREVQQYVNEYNSLTLNEEAMKRIRDSKNYAIDSVTFDKLKTTLLHDLNREGKASALRNVLDSVDAYKDTMKDSLEEKLMLVETEGTKKSYETALKDPRLNVNPPMTGSKLSKFLMDVNEFSRGHGFDPDVNQPFAKDSDTNRLAFSIGILHRMGRLKELLPDPTKYTGVDRAGYSGQHERFTILFNKIDAYLQKNINTKDKDRIAEIRNQINDKKGKEAAIPTEEINLLFEGLEDANEAPRRQKFISQTKKQIDSYVDKQIVKSLVDGYFKMKKNPDDFVKDCNNITANFRKDILRHNAEIMEAKDKKIFTERQKYMDDYSKKYYLHENKSFFRKLFDFKGAKARNEARDILQSKYGFSDAMLDITKYGSKITKKQLISAIKQGSHELDKQLIDETIGAHDWDKSRDVMKAYAKFCKKTNLRASYAYFAPVKMTPKVAEQPVANVQKQEAVNNPVAQEVRKRVNVGDLEKDTSVVVNQDNNVKTQSAVIENENGSMVA